MKLIVHILMIIFLSTNLALGEERETSLLFKKAKKYFFQKKFSMAELLLQDVLQRDPEHHKAYSYLGDIFLNSKRYDAALKMYRRGIDLKPQNAENYFRLGQIYYYKKLSNLALENFRKTLELDSSLNFSYFHIGLTYLMLLRNKEKTIENWRTYLRLAPEDPQYENIRRAIALLMDPKFELPSPESDVTIQEALLLGGITLKKVERKAEDHTEGHEKRKTNKKLEEIYLDDDL